MTDDHQPIVEEYSVQMNAIAHFLDDELNHGAMPKRTGFVLLVFPFGAGEDHRCNYISNADRGDMITAMKEFIARAEGRYVERRGNA